MEGAGTQEGGVWCRGERCTHHGGAGGEAEELGDQCVDVQAHDLGGFEQQRLEAAQGGELYYTV